jgi:hypothetical protein
MKSLPRDQSRVRPSHSRICRVHQIRLGGGGGVRLTITGLLGGDSLPMTVEEVRGRGGETGGGWGERRRSGGR